MGWQYLYQREKRFKIRGMIVGTTTPEFEGNLDFVYRNTWLIGAGAAYEKEYNVNNGYEYRLNKYARFGVQFELNF